TLLSFYLQVVPSCMRSYRVVILATVAYTAIGYIVSISVALFLCFPIWKNWYWGGRSISLPMSSVCFPMELSSVQSNRNCSVFLLPFPILHKLQVRRAVRIGAYCTFGLGVINIAVCLARFLVIHLAFTNRPPSITVTSLWGNLDSSIAVLIACLPSLRPYLRIISQALTSRSRSSRSSEPRTKLRVLSKTGSKNFERIQDNPSLKTDTETEV
ncbi:uncharacterized protein SETTUDRAFT_110740, partial [Exserohilum turcica Et28A]